MLTYFAKYFILNFEPKEIVIGFTTKCVFLNTFFRKKLLAFGVKKKNAPRKCSNMSYQKGIVILSY